MKEKVLQAMREFGQPVNAGLIVIQDNAPSHQSRRRKDADGSERFRETGMKYYLQQLLQFLNINGIPLSYLLGINEIQKI